MSLKKVALLGEYTNGNYKVRIFDDGTKIRETEEDEFLPVYPECMDVKITNCCNMNCPYCHENSSVNGTHGDILNVKFIDTLLPYTELAIGGGNPISHPDIVNFLMALKQKKIVANVTVNQTHFLDNIDFLKMLCDDKLIYGLGISLTQHREDLIDIITEKFPNAVLHVINGIVEVDDLKKMYDKGLKVLILGYKRFRKGKGYYSNTVRNKMKELYDELPNISGKFDVVSFDNLAIEQLEVKRLLTPEQWEEFYMGNDGQFTMYVDLVDKTFARCSVANDRYDIQDNIVDMFQKIRNESTNKLETVISTAEVEFIPTKIIVE